MSFAETPLLSFDDLVADDRGRRVVGSHLVEHHILHGAVNLFPSKHAIVEGSGHRLGYQLQDIQVGKLCGVQDRTPFSLK